MAYGRSKRYPCDDGYTTRRSKYIPNLSLEEIVALAALDGFFIDEATASEIKAAAADTNQSNRTYMRTRLSWSSSGKHIRIYPPDWGKDSNYECTILAKGVDGSRTVGVVKQTSIFGKVQFIIATYRLDAKDKWLRVDEVGSRYYAKDQCLQWGQRSCESNNVLFLGDMDIKPGRKIKPEERTAMAIAIMKRG